MKTAISITTTSITNDKEHDAAINQLLVWEKDNEGGKHEAQIEVLAAAVMQYEEAQGFTPAPPSTIAGILEVEMYKRRLNQRALAATLGITETRLSEILKGKREVNLDLARKLYQKLNINPEALLTLPSHVKYLQGA